MTTQPFVMFLTGVSGAGKTTAYKALKNDPSVVARDIDEDGIPAAGSGPWRQFRVELLLHEALESLKAGVSTIICGATYPQELIWTQAFDSTLNIWVVALEVSPDQIRSRLQERLQRQAEPVAYESYKANRVERIIWDNIDLQPRFVHAVRALQRGVVLNAVSLDAGQVVSEIRSVMVQIGALAHGS